MPSRGAPLGTTIESGTLVPGMFVQMRFAEPVRQPALLVPSDAVIHTGRRSVVMLAGVTPSTSHWRDSPAPRRCRVSSPSGSGMRRRRATISR